MKKAKHPFPAILKIPRNARVTGVANLSVEKQEQYRLLPTGDDGESVKHPLIWGRTRGAAKK